jgi:hypothetical protein
MITPLLKQDPHLISRTLSEARELFSTLNDVERRLGTPAEKPGDLGLAQHTAHRIRNRQVLLMVIKNHLHYHDPEIEYLCRYVPDPCEAKAS